MNPLSISLLKPFRVFHCHLHAWNYVIGDSPMVSFTFAIVLMFLPTPKKTSFTFIMITPLQDTQDASKPLNSFNATIDGLLCPLMSAIMLMDVHYANK